MMDYIIHKINGNIHHHMKGGWVMRGGNTDGDEEQLDWNGFSKPRMKCFCEFSISFRKQEIELGDHHNDDGTLYNNFMK